jgi:S1-C subfamily serine protease
MIRPWLLATLLLLTGCTTPDGGPRSFDISSGGFVEPSAAIMQDIEPLLSRTSRSYVTLIVHDSSTVDSSPADRFLADAMASGSGFFIDDNGHVLTAAHVAINRNWRVEATGPDGRTYNGTVVDVLPENDIALIKLDRVSDVAPVVPAANACLSPGDPVYSLGKPRERGDTARLGRVESMSFGRPVTYDGFGYPDAMVMRLQTRKGESGGPVFNRSGELVGMVVSTLSDASGNHLDLAHAIPVPSIARFVCGAIDCSAAWQALTGTDTARCPNQTAQTTPTSQ